MPENTYQQAAGTQTAFAQGFSDMLRHLLESSNQTAQQAAGGTTLSPESQAPAGDVLYGLGGYFPAQEMSQAGAGWQSFFNQAPSFTEQILNRNASQYSALASANARARASSSADDKSMSEYQAASLALRQEEADRDAARFEYQMSQDDLDRELEYAKFALEGKKYKSDLGIRKLMAQVAISTAGVRIADTRADNARANKKLALDRQKEKRMAREGAQKLANAQTRLDQANARIKIAQKQLALNAKNQKANRQLARAREARLQARAAIQTIKDVYGITHPSGTTGGY